MAKVVITIDDRTNERGEPIVEIKSHPTFEGMAQLINSGHESPSSHVYALRMHRAARELNKDLNEGKGPKIFLPGLGR